MPTAFPPPVNISPLIKLFRWGLLITGMVHGAVKHKYYYAKELAVKDIRIQEKIARDQFLKVERRRINREQMLDLGRQLAGLNETEEEAEVAEESIIDPSESVIELPPEARSKEE